MENNKKILIGVGVLAVVGLSYFLWKKKESSETEKPEEKANAFGRRFSIGKIAKSDCPVGCECYGGKANCFTNQ